MKIEDKNYLLTIFHARQTFMHNFGNYISVSSDFKETQSRAFYLYQKILLFFPRISSK